MGAPPYDPALVDQRSWHDLYGHDGDAPYWAAAGVYPPYPLDPPPAIAGASVGCAPQRSPQQPLWVHSERHGKAVS